MGNIENLLRRQYEGTITPEEQSELDRLTHRDQNILVATQRAMALRRRNQARVVGVASVLLVVGAIFLVRSFVVATEDEPYLIARTEMAMPQIAESKTASSVIPARRVLIDSNKFALDKEESIEEVTIERQIPTSVVPPSIGQSVLDEVDADIRSSTISNSEPIVACNTACSPDSVINDIWKFLRT